MSPDDARRLLGVDDDAGADDVRRAFRRLVRDHHPDRAGGDADVTRALLDAYRTLQSPAEDAPAINPLLVLLEHGSLELELPPDEAFLVLLDAAADVGDVTHVDAESGLLEVVRTDVDGSRTSLVLTLQGRAATGTTEIFLTEEPLG